MLFWYFVCVRVDLYASPAPSHHFQQRVVSLVEVLFLSLLQTLSQNSISISGSLLMTIDRCCYLHWFNRSFDHFRLLFDIVITFLGTIVTPNKFPHGAIVVIIQSIILLAVKTLVQIQRRRRPELLQPLYRLHNSREMKRIIYLQNVRHDPKVGAAHGESSYKCNHSRTSIVANKRSITVVIFVH